MFEIKPKNDKTKQSIAFYTLVLTFKKFSLIRNVILVSPNRPKKQPNFWKDFCPKSCQIKKHKGSLYPNGMISF